jgi:hypothetical protein
MTELDALVAGKLQTTAGDWRLFRSRIPRRVLEREAYEAEVLAHFQVTRSWLERRDLVAASLFGQQVLIALGSHNAGFIAAGPLQRKLARYSLHPRQPRHYAEYFGDDARETAAIAATDPRTAGPSMRRLFAISAQRAPRRKRRPQRPNR